MRSLLIGMLLASPSLALAQPSHGSPPTLALGGDVLYDAPLAYQVTHRAREVGRREAYREVFRDLRRLFAEADFALVNLEVPISARYRERTPEEDVPVFRAPAHFLTALREAGVDAVTLANNHAYDQGVRGLSNTLEATRRERVHAIGIGDDAPSAAHATVVEVDGARVAIAAWTEGSNHRPSRGEGGRPRIAFLRDGTVARAIGAARREADLVIAVFHWVHEDLTRPRPLMRRVAREAAEAGADLIVGHGTHVPGSTERIRTSDGREVRVLYSLGNLLAAMEEPAGTLASHEVGVRDAPVALVRTRWASERLQIDDVEVRHHWIARPVGRAPWAEGGRLAVSCPVAIDDELERLAQSGCGAPCDRRASAYRRRVALMERAMADLALPAPSEPPAVASAPPRRPRRRAAEPVARPRHRPRRARPAPARRAARRRIADDDPRLRPYLRGVGLGVRFPEGRARESEVDRSALGRLAALLREDRSLRVEVVGYATEAEREGHATLGSLRARRVKGLIAILGPSRSRFTTRGGTGPARVVVRVRR